MSDVAFGWFLGAVGALFVLLVAHSARQMWHATKPLAADYLDRPMPDSLWASRVVSYGALFAVGYAALLRVGPRNAEGAAGLMLVGAIGAWAIIMAHWTLHHVVYSIEGEVFTARGGLLVARTRLDAIESMERVRLSPWRRGWRGWLERGSFPLNRADDVVRIGMSGNRAIYVCPADADGLMQRLRAGGARPRG